MSNKEAAVALGVVEALAVNAGEKSLLFRVGTSQPLAEALSFADRKVQFSAAIAFAEAGPVSAFTGSELIVKHLASAILKEGQDEIGEELSSAYAMRAVQAAYKLALSRNKVVDLSLAQSALVAVTTGTWPEMQTAAADVLAYLASPEAQRAIAAMAMNEQNEKAVRLAGFMSLSRSAKLNANLLLSEQIDALYAMVASVEADAELRAGAAGAFGALNLPSERVRTLILERAKF